MSISRKMYTQQQQQQQQQNLMQIYTLLLKIIEAPAVVSS